MEGAGFDLKLNSNHLRLMFLTKKLMKYPAGGSSYREPAIGFLSLGYAQTLIISH